MTRTSASVPQSPAAERSGDDVPARRMSPPSTAIVSHDADADDDRGADDRPARWPGIPMRSSTTAIIRSYEHHGQRRSKALPGHGHRAAIGGGDPGLPPQPGPGRRRRPGRSPTSPAPTSRRSRTTSVRRSGWSPSPRRRARGRGRTRCSSSLDRPGDPATRLLGAVERLLNATFDEQRDRAPSAARGLRATPRAIPTATTR